MMEMISNGIKNGTMLLFTTASQNSRPRKPVGGKAAPNVDLFDYGRIISRDGGGVVTAVENGWRTESVNNPKIQAPTTEDRGLILLVFCKKRLEARIGIEPMYTALQAAA